MSQPRVLLIEDHEPTRRQLTWALQEEFEVLTAGDPETGLGIARDQAPPVILLDLGLPPTPSTPEAGLRCLRELRHAIRPSKVIVCTGHTERRYALQAIREGAYDFITKPVGLDLLKVLLRRACWLTDLECETAIHPAVSPAEVKELTGESDGIRLVSAAIQKVAPTDVPVLLTGESGTGKELAAHAIHARSRRKDGPFIPINCGAIPETLLESELFGHEKGAFTGAWQQQKGKLEYAEGGTLFLDEVGDLPSLLQVKLLRFLQDRRLERVGGRRAINLDTRVIAATNRDLREAIAGGQFREDLYYRLGVVVIHLPPLRERGEDVLLMAQSFLQQSSVLLEKRIGGFSREAMQALLAHPWPGNVRELSNRIQRAVVMAEGPEITPEDLELQGLPQESNPLPNLRAARRRFDAALVLEMLSSNGGNVRQTAEALGVSRPTVYAVLRRHGIRPKALRKVQAA